MKMGFPHGAQPPHGLVQASQPAVHDPADELLEMANLPRSDTGVDGIMYISTAQGQQDPRVKWFPYRPSRDAPCLTVPLEAEPRVVNHGVPPAQARAAEAQVQRWVALNREALLGFWQDGLSWTRDEVNSFIDRLVKLS